MKTIVRNEDKISIYLLPADTEIEALDDRIIVGSPVEFVIADCNSENVTVYNAMTPPTDWAGWKYAFDGKNWLPNPEFEAEPS